MRMSKEELYTWFCKFGEFDVRVKKSIAGDDIYRAVFPKTLFQHEIPAEDIRWYKKKGWIDEKQILQQGIIRNVIYWTGEKMAQRSAVKRNLEKMGVRGVAEKVVKGVDHFAATFILWIKWFLGLG